MGLLWRHSGSLLGLDIGTTAVKLVELSRLGTGYRVEAWGVEPLPAHATDGDNISDAEAVGEVIARLVKRAGTRTRTAAVAVSASSAVVSTVAMDASLTDAELELEVAAEAEHRIPYPVEQAALDFEARNLKPDDPSLVEVVVAACPMAHVLSLEEALASGGLSTAIVDIETFCLQRVLEAQCVAASAAPVALAEIGAATTKLLVLHGSETFARQEPFDGARWQRERLVDQAAAEALFHDDLVRLLARLLRLYASVGGSGQDGLAKLLLCGGVAASEDLAATATERLGVPATVADPFAGMALGSRVDTALLRRHAPALVTACGLALRSFDR